jgi:hypothetical protein
MTQLSSQQAKFTSAEGCATDKKKAQPAASLLRFLILTNPTSFYIKELSIHEFGISRGSGR